MYASALCKNGDYTKACEVYAELKNVSIDYAKALFACGRYSESYVFVLAVGMLLCILTGGNIDLAVGSVVCFAGAVGGKLMDAHMNVYLAVVFMVNRLFGVVRGERPR